MGNGVRRRSFDWEWDALGCNRLLLEQVDMEVRQEKYH